MIYRYILTAGDLQASFERHINLVPRVCHLPAPLSSKGREDERPEVGGTI